MSVCVCQEWSQWTGNEGKEFANVEGSLDTLAASRLADIEGGDAVENFIEEVVGVSASWSPSSPLNSGLEGLRGMDMNVCCHLQ